MGLKILTNRTVLVIIQDKVEALNQRPLVMKSDPPMALPLSLWMVKS